MSRLNFGVWVLVIVVGLSNGYEEEKCGEIADIAFVLDSSRSISRLNFTTEKEFVCHLIDMFDVKPDKTQVAALQFGSDVKVEFNFNEVKNAEEAHQQVRGIKHSFGETTLTHLALEAARTQLFSSNNGARANVRKVIILLSDGASTQTEMTKEEARRVKAAGITIMAVGIGKDINQIWRELEEAVTAPASENFFYAITFDELKTKHFQNHVGKQACDDPNDDPDKTCQGKEADVVFVLDQSNSIWNPHFKQQLQFINDTVDMFDISSGKTQVGAAVFSDGADVVFDLNRYNNKEDISKAVMGIQQRGGLTTNTHLAINVRGYSFTVVGDYRTGARIINGLTTKVVLVLDQMYTKKGGYRPSVAQICIIITDGNSTQPTLTADVAQKAREQGVIMIAIGVGNMTNSQELNDIASGKEYVFEVNGYKILPLIKDRLAYDTCTATKSFQGKAAKW